MALGACRCREPSTFPRSLLATCWPSPRSPIGVASLSVTEPPGRLLGSQGWLRL